MVMMARPRRRPLVDENALRRAAEAVEDPEIHRALGELGMVRQVAAGRDGVAHIEVALTTPTCPMRDRLRAEVAAAAATVDGVVGVEVTFSALTERERVALAGRLRRADGKGLDGRTQVFAVASGKGGVGKSTVAANVAVALAAAGKRVAVLDADVWGYSVPQLFGVRRNPVALHGLMLPVEAHGVRLMSVGFFVDDAEPVVWRGPMLHKALQQFLFDVHWGEVDVLLIDLPPGTGDVTLSLLELVPQAALVAVTTPQPAAQTVASRVGRMATDMRMPVAGVVENMSTLVCGCCGGRTALFGSGGGTRLADELGTQLLGSVPLDVELRAAGDEGIPVLIQQPLAPSAVAFADLATQLLTVRRPLAGIPLPLTVTS
ncbi:Mrp/NBP35 family ATP-binding protein [Mycobacterium sherrisii]|uniref:Iron-sulfur cluster carrier protein n=1 Tax=Mycobacterium sherrisii TaxID=243061 RepID=A0A1E3T0T8_9MYCO|nr:P-loop NTPase [Mycobacterium sherrisii]MCV7028284.1 Mrp/NBP35 family ATP-binding protein [Mycobacterium sherrisii]ODR07977.1 sodium:proton antiporter [Mycobacterium sherrisii]ORW77878.1 sodium:proton antiporter [Mycobacterium sherrisii]